MDLAWWQLNKETRDGDVLEKIVVYQRANKEVMTISSGKVSLYSSTLALCLIFGFPLQVAIICNHQRTVSKTHSAQMSRLEEKISELQVMIISVTFAEILGAHYL